MAKNYRYPLGGFWNTTTKFGNQTPIYYQEVVPGQSLHGTARVKLVTDSVIKIALNRMWYDTFFFYIPYRLLHSDWPAWISGDDTATAPPTVNDTWFFNFEGNLVAGGSPRTENVAWQRYAYNYVWNKAFRGTDQAEVPLTDNNVLPILNRARSWQNQLNENTLPTETAASLDIEDIKLSMSEYRRKRQEYFFQGPENREYLGLLERMGVQAGWEVDDEPRLIGQYHAQATFETVMNTGTSTASPSGLWSGHCEVKFGSKLFPEHGIVAGYLVPRMEFPHYRAGNIHPMLYKTERHHYYTDGQRNRTPQSWPDEFAGGGIVSVNQVAPAWEDYRTPVSQMFAGEDTSAPWDKNYAIVGESLSVAGASDLRDYQHMVDNSDFFRGFLGDGEVAIYTELSGHQRSPVPPRQVNI